MEYVASIHPKMQQIYYEFFENGALKAGLLDLKEGDYFFTEKDGLYIVDIEKIRIRVKGGIDSNIFKIENNILTLSPVVKGKVSQKGYMKFEKVN